MVVGGQSNVPAALPGERPGTHFMEAGLAPGPVWTGVEKSRPPTRLDPRTGQPVASRYTDWAIPAY